jgi:type II restriction/modification system DNA methylase subunit YeeA
MVKFWKRITAKEPLPRDSEARTVIARRLIAERCLYGVDLNPLAVELAKLSIWLVTLAKGRPFGFLDHNLRCGDSLDISFKCWRWLGK